MGLHRALFAAGFQRQATYRLALISGLATNVFFGLIRTALFVALYDERASVGGLDRGRGADLRVGGAVALRDRVGGVDLGAARRRAIRAPSRPS